jgi:hypothetical protein
LRAFWEERTLPSGVRVRWSGGHWRDWRKLLFQKEGTGHRTLEFLCALDIAGR